MKVRVCARSSVAGVALQHVRLHMWINCEACHKQHTSTGRLNVEENAAAFELSR